MTTGPTRFRKLPVEIDAMQIPDMDDPEGWRALAGWLGAHGEEVEVVEVAQTCLNALLISTLEGVMRGDVGDWIIRGVQGEFYPCKPDIFAKTYETAEPDDVDRLLASDQLPQRHGADAATMRGVFADLAYRVWVEGEDFSGKRPFGNSGWWSDFLESIVAAGIAEDDETADDLARRAIRRMGGDEA